MLIGYVRVSKSDGTQTLAPQQDAMLAAGVDPTRIFWTRCARLGCQSDPFQPSCAGNHR